MSVGRGLGLGMVVLSVAFSAATCAFAEDMLPASTAPQTEQASAMPASYTQSAPSAAAQNGAQDGLHLDARWPHFASCINRTTTPDAFEECLRSAFLADSTGKELALLQR